MLEILSTPGPLLVSVIAVAAVEVPRPWLPKETVVGDRVTPGTTPVPVKAMLSGLEKPPPDRASVALRELEAVGANVTAMVQVVPGARLPEPTGQVLV